MDTKLAARQIRLQQWTAIIKDRTASGLKIDDYCKHHGISRNAYFYWLRKVREAALIQSGFVELEPPADTPDEADEHPSLEANINGITLSIREGVSMDLLSKVIRVLKDA